MGLLLIALGLYLAFLPAQAEAAWEQHGAAGPAGPVVTASDEPETPAADAAHLLTEDRAHLSHVEDAPLERSPTLQSRGRPSRADASLAEHR